jgi:hypothetical protein
MIAATGRFPGVVKFDVFQKVVDDPGEFDAPIKVLRMGKDGEPFLHKRLADMIARPILQRPRTVRRQGSCPGWRMFTRS